MNNNNQYDLRGLKTLSKQQLALTTLELLKLVDNILNDIYKRCDTKPSDKAEKEQLLLNKIKTKTSDLLRTDKSATELGLKGLNGGLPGSVYDDENDQSFSYTNSICHTMITIFTKILD